LVSKKDQRKADAEKRKRLQPLTNKLKKVERQLATLNAKKESIEVQLADSDIYSDKNKADLKDLLQSQIEVSKAIDTQEEEWMMLSEEIESST